EVLFLHGKTKRKDRDEMVTRFADKKGPKIFILSLKAGGTGLNLTAANHVFHIDRWWNPAVEDQATDRAFRIGQSKNVEVHLMIAGGTLEEKIDAVLEDKRALAGSIIGTGEDWITGLSTEDLRELLSLRKSTAGGVAL
ncbi:MAG: C-terminal helicase domain-containing protein, partial [Methanoregula sp.]|nr:C-terminal helicase domain-containing protein [Methanoregula sp.]